MAYKRFTSRSFLLSTSQSPFSSLLTSEGYDSPKFGLHLASQGRMTWKESRIRDGVAWCSSPAAVFSRKGGQNWGQVAQNQALCIMPNISRPTRSHVSPVIKRWTLFLDCSICAARSTPTTAASLWASYLA